MIRKLISLADFYRDFPVLKLGGSLTDIGIAIHYRDDILFWRTPDDMYVIVVRNRLLRTTEWFVIFDQCVSYLMRTLALSSMPDLMRCCVFFSADSSEFDVLAERPVFREPRDQSIALFEEIFAMAVVVHATDIHCDIRHDQGQVSFRVHGVLSAWQIFSSETLMSALAAAYTLLGEERSRSDAGFNRRIPQSALLLVASSGVERYCRFQSHPIVGGLSVVLRILCVSYSEALLLSQLGFSDPQYACMTSFLSHCSGLMMLSGPTGSGKTTTLASLMHACHERHPGKKMYSIEDPVEYELPWVAQISIQRSISDTLVDEPFIHALRAFLRMDPDVGMIGEVRDRQTAALVQTAVETGHCILSTVHARSALDVFSRLVQLGMSPYLVYEPGFLRFSVHQRLMPVLCSFCSRPALEVLTEQQRSFLGDYDCQSMRCRHEQGCTHCMPGQNASLKNNALNGLSGQTVVAEICIPDDYFLRLLSDGQRDQAKGYHDERWPDMLSWSGHLLRKVALGMIDPRVYISVMT